MRRRVLLLEPNYKNKFPPIGLMKLATYFRLRGDDVVFYKGDLTEFVIRQITEECVEQLSKVDDAIDWKRRFDRIDRPVLFIADGKGPVVRKRQRPHLVRLRIAERRGRAGRR